MEITVEPSKQFHINLVLSEREALVLRVIMGSVIGNPMTDPREVAYKLHNALANAGVPYTNKGVGRLELPNDWSAFEAEVIQ